MDPRYHPGYLQGVHPNEIYPAGVYVNDVSPMSDTNSSSATQASERSSSRSSRRTGDDVHLAPNIVKHASNNKQGYQLAFIRKSKRSLSSSLEKESNRPSTSSSSSSSMSSGKHVSYYHKTTQTSPGPSTAKYHTAPMPPPAATAPLTYSTWDAAPKYSTWDASPKYTTTSPGMKTSPSTTPQSISSASASPPAAFAASPPATSPSPPRKTTLVEQEIQYLTNKVDFLQQQLKQAKAAQEAAGYEGSMEAQAAARAWTGRVRAEWIEAREQLGRLLG